MNAFLKEINLKQRSGMDDVQVNTAEYPSELFEHDFREANQKEPHG